MKKNFEFILLTFFVASLFIFSSCDPEKKESVKKSIIEITKDIDSPTTWTSGNTYKIAKSDFRILSILTIEHGVTILIPSSPDKNTINLSAASGAKGRIVANGTSSNPIIFASTDSNGDYSKQIPMNQHWGKVNLNGTTENVFNHCKFYHGGNGTQASPTLEIGSGQAKITNCNFGFCGGGVKLGGSYHVGALDAKNSKKETVIENNRFYGNELPLTINIETNLDDSNSFSHSGHSNRYNAIYVNGGSLNKDTFWGETEVAFVITAATIDIVKDLTLSDDVVIKFVENSGLNLIGSQDRIINHDGKGVFFTSIKDDELKGDSNGDSKASKPAAADWRGIYLEKTRHYLDWPNIKYNDVNVNI